MQYVPIAVIARWSGREVSGIRKACLSGKLKAYKIGGTWLINKDAARKLWR